MKGIIAGLGRGPGGYLSADCLFHGTKGPLFSTTKEWASRGWCDEHEPRAWGWGPAGHLGRDRGGSNTDVCL